MTKNLQVAYSNSNLKLGPQTLEDAYFILTDDLGFLTTYDFKVTNTATVEVLKSASINFKPRVITDSVGKYYAASSVDTSEVKLFAIEEVSEAASITNSEYQQFG